MVTNSFWRSLLALFFLKLPDLKVVLFVAKDTVSAVVILVEVCGRAIDWGKGHYTPSFPRIGGSWVKAALATRQICRSLIDIERSLGPRFPNDGIGTCPTNSVFNHDIVF